MIRFRRKLGEHSKNTRTRFYFCDKTQMHSVAGKTTG